MFEFKCELSGICKHHNRTNGSDCTVREICRFFRNEPLEIFRELKVSPDGSKISFIDSSKTKNAKPKRKYTKRELKVDMDDSEVSVISKKSFDKARKKIAYAELHDKLTENQKLALKPLKGLHFKTMTEAQQEQIINIARDL